MLSKQFKIIILLIFLFSISNIFSQKSRKFVVILDAGHGGKDPGNSYHGFVEKKIALQTTLKLEKYLKKDSDIKIVFTRKRDAFVELDVRPKMANNSNGDLFISIHCNSVKNQKPYGTETFVMGLSRSDTNLEIAKTENSVIFLEKDYKETYKGFNPKKSETLIGLKILQEEYLDRSIKLASKIESNFKNKLKRKSRGIKQSPLWVLDATFMPSVLVELGFLSNKAEGRYLNSDLGQNKMAEAIANAIISYKKEYFGTASSNKIKQSEEKVVENTDANSDNVLFKVQIAASSKKIKLAPYNFKGLKNVSVSTDNGVLYKYVYGSTSDYNVAKQNLELAKSKGFNSAYLIAFRNGKKISIQEAIK